MAGMIELPESSWWDWDILYFDGSHLCMAAGSDLTYHHTLEVVFSDVVYLACPISFQHPRFREPTLRERALVQRHVGEEPPLIVAFDVEAPAGEEPLACLVAAGSVESLPGVVYRYWREDLAPGERLARFVPPPEAS